MARRRQAACQQIKARLAALMVELAGGGSADAVRFADGQVRLADFSLPPFAELAMRAYRARVQLGQRVLSHPGHSL